VAQFPGRRIILGAPNHSVGSGVTDGRIGVRAASPWQAKCKKWVPLLACISVFSFLLCVCKILCLAFFKNLSECFPVISGVSTNESS